MLLFISFYTSATALFTSSLVFFLLIANSSGNSEVICFMFCSFLPEKKCVLQCGSKMFCLLLECFIIWLLTEQKAKIKEHPWGMLRFEHINIPTEITNMSHQPYKPHLSACFICPSHLPWPPREQHGPQSSAPSTQQLQPLFLAPATGSGWDGDLEWRPAAPECPHALCVHGHSWLMLWRMLYHLTFCPFERCFATLSWVAIQDVINSLYSIRIC